MVLFHGGGARWVGFSTGSWVGFQLPVAAGSIKKDVLLRSRDLDRKRDGRRA